MAFCRECGTQLSDKAFSCPQCGRPQPIIGGRNRITAAFLAFFAGWIGAHKFYLGKPMLGVVYLLFFWTLIPMIASIVDFIVLLSMDDAGFNLKYNKQKITA